MKSKIKGERKVRGVALIIVIGVLSLLVIIGTYFAINMQLEQKAAANYLNSVKARYVAEAGMQKALADIRNLVINNAYSSLITGIDAYSLSESFGDGSYSVSVEREDSKTDLNSATQTQLEAAMFSAAQAANIVTYRNTYNFFTTIEEVKAVGGVSDATFQSVKSNITANSPIIRGGLVAKYYDDKSMADANFVGEIVELGPIKTISVAGAEYEPNASYDASFAGCYLISSPTRWGLDNFGVKWEGYLYLPPTGTYPDTVTFYLSSDDGSRLYIDNTLVVNNWTDGTHTDVSGSYIFTASGWHRIKLEYYDNALLNFCELKWNLSGSTEYIPAENLGFYPPKGAGFTYNSAGNLRITSTGQLTSGAESKIEAVIKIFGTWTQTCRSEFSAPWTSERGSASGNPNPGYTGYYLGDYSDGWVRNVTWLDSCPDNAGDDLETGGYTATSDALKLGYWDDFDEDVAYSVINLAGMATKRIEGSDKQGGSWWWQAYRIFDPAQSADPNYFAIDYGCFDSTGANNRLKIWTNVWDERHFEVNYNFYRPVTNVFARTWAASSADTKIPSERLGWRGNAANTVPEADWGQIPTGDARHWVCIGPWVPQYYWDKNGNNVWDAWFDVNSDGIYTDGVDTPAEPRPVYRVYNNPNDQVPLDSARAYIYGSYKGPTTPAAYTDDATCPYNYPIYSATGTYWQPIVGFMCPSIFAMGQRTDPCESGRTDSCGVGYYAVLIDEEGWAHTGGDRLETIIWNRNVSTAYQKERVLAMIKGSSSNDYKAYLINGAAVTASVQATPGPITAPTNFKFKNANLFDTWTWDSYNALWIRGVEDIITDPDFTETNTAYWDNIRFIPDSGFLVSTPFYTGGDIDWGRLSWADNTATVSNVGVAVGLRTVDTKANLPTGDSGWTSCANGAQITNTDYPWLQYKVTLSTTALNKDSYANSGKTPTFKDITITYLPQIEILFYREITED